MPEPGERDRPLRVAVVAEYYPRPGKEAWGIWAHRQARAVTELGVEVRVLALDRPLPSLHALGSLLPRPGRPPTTRPLSQWLRQVRKLPQRAQLDEIDVRYVRFISPPRPTSYGSWGRWAAKPLGRALDRLRAEWPFDMIHAHYAIPAGDASLRWIDARGHTLPVMVSVHGGDLSYAATRSPAAEAGVAHVLQAADLVAANSSITRHGIDQLAGPIERLETIYLGADVPTSRPRRHDEPTLVTLGHLEGHKNQQSVIRALAALGERHPRLRYTLIGDGPDRSALVSLADSLGVSDRVTFLGSLPHDQALVELGRCHLHVLPSLHDAFGVAHIEAMAAGLPTIGGSGTGAEDIAAAGEGVVLVASGDVGAITRAIDGLVSNMDGLEHLGGLARQTVEANFSWQKCGERTVSAYEQLVGEVEQVRL